MDNIYGKYPTRSSAHSKFKLSVQQQYNLRTVTLLVCYAE